jgi:NADH-quinone oxidoreductase subunit L
MNESVLLIPILLPFVAGLLVLALGMKRRSAAVEPAADGSGSQSILPAALTLLVTLSNLALTFWLFDKKYEYTVPWAGYGMAFSLRLYQFSAFILAAAGGFAFLVSLYCLKFMKDRRHAGQFYAYLLISVAMTNGAVLADHLVVLLFFWEGLLATLFGMIAIGRAGAWKTATKALIIVGITDLCMLLGIALTGWQAGTLTMSKIHLSLAGWSSLAMIMLMIGAISKAGSMPFHSWIPDAAVDAPLPFMAILPASLEKLLGIYLLARISLDLFDFTPGSWISLLMMTIGAVTIIAAVMMALVQKDYKRLLSYHAISQVGYMILGIGTALPVGIVGGLFHMINHAMYKSCLFLTGGAVEKQAGTTELAKLGGLARKMPVTFTCFLVAAAAISGVPPLNGFFSKELVYDAAKDRHIVFYLAAIMGTFFTAASFLKLGHAAYVDKPRGAVEKVKEAPLSMLAPMIVIAALCLLFGVMNALPLDNLIVPVLAGSQFAAHHGVGEHHFAGWPTDMFLVVMTCLILALAVGHHLMGVRMSGSGLLAAEHIHHARLLEGVYSRAERRFFDPYDIGLKVAGGLARVLWWCDRGVDWVYDGLAVGVTLTLSRGVRLAHTGNYAMYVIWSLLGAAAIIIALVKSV